MPVYEYRCMDCGETWERTEHIEEHDEVAHHAVAPPPCPGCKGNRVEQVFSAFFAKTAKKS